MKIKVKIGDRKQDEIKLEITDITDAVEVYTAAQNALGGSNQFAVIILEMVEKGQFEVVNE
jgi:hypothetical protein